MDREKDIRLYEPESMEADASLSGEAREHRDLHLALKKAGQEVSEKLPALGDDFNEKLLARLESAVKDPSALPPLNDADFVFPSSDLPSDPAGGWYKRPLFWRISAVLLVGVGIVVAIRSIEEPSSPDGVQKAAKEPLAEAEPLNEPLKEPAQGLPEAPSFAAPLPDAGDNPPMMGTAPPAGVEGGIGGDDSVVNPEADLRQRIESETDQEKRRQLQEQLLRVYEATGQVDRARRLRESTR